MVAALELYLDPVADRRLRRLWDALEEAGVPSLRDLTHGRHRPHVSLVAAPELHGAGLVGALDGLDVAPPLRLQLDHVGLFRGRVLWLGPVPTAELLAHHAAVYARLAAAGASAFDEYRPGAWVPHCTLSMRVPHARIPDALRLCLDTLPITATVAGAALADHSRDLYIPLAPPAAGSG
ncbi:MAG TPA: 2'-5' RNA ligase family protein [Rugosimonospora sp.]|nr:2'-5' RNA ligase family protein [Rugosimonospora sp.]